MGRAHIEDVFYGGEEGGPIEIIVPKSLRKHTSADRCRFVLHVFAFHANDENRTFPSVSKVADAVCFDQRKVRVAIKVLECNGLLVKIANYKVGKKGITYYFNLPSFCEFPRPTEQQIVDKVWDSDHAVCVEPDSLSAPTLGTHLETPACDKEEQEVKIEQEKELCSKQLFEVGSFEWFWDCYPRKSSIEKRAHAEWKFVVASVGVSAVVSALAQLLSAPLQNSDDYQPAHEWLADLVNKS